MRRIEEIKDITKIEEVAVEGSVTSERISSEEKCEKKQVLLEEEYILSLLTEKHDEWRRSNWDEEIGNLDWWWGDSRDGLFTNAPKGFDVNVYYNADMRCFMCAVYPLSSLSPIYKGVDTDNQIFSIPFKVEKLVCKKIDPKNRDEEEKNRLMSEAYLLGIQSRVSGLPQPAFQNSRYREFSQLNMIDVHLGKDIDLDIAVTNSYNDGYENGIAS